MRKKIVTILLIIISLVTVVFMTVPQIWNEEQGFIQSKRVKELRGKDKRWLEKASRYGHNILKWYSKTDEVTLTHLDDAFEAWKKDHSENRAPDGMVVSGLGVLFGNYIIKNRDAKWAVVSDNCGKNLAVVSSRGEAVYPIGSVSRRVHPDNKEERFFEVIWSVAIEDSFQ